MMTANDVAYQKFTDETGMLPAVMALTVAPENEAFAQYAVKRTLHHFETLPQFRRGCLRSGNRGRDYLYSFMEHWFLSGRAERVF